MHCCISAFGYTVDIASWNPVSPSMQIILYSAVFKSVKDRKPVLCTFVFIYIHAKYIFFAVHIDPYGYIYRFFDYSAFTTDIVMNRVHKNHGIDIFKRSLLPFFHNRKYFIRDSTGCLIPLFRKYTILSSLQTICQYYFPQ
nr:MAG TPA: hypothetical protein [Caudoviricetes sp.]